MVFGAGLSPLKESQMVWIKWQLTSNSSRCSTAVVIFVKCPSAEGTHLNWSYVVKIAPEYSFKGGF